MWLQGHINSSYMGKSKSDYFHMWYLSSISFPTISNKCIWYTVNQVFQLTTNRVGDMSQVIYVWSLEYVLKRLGRWEGGYKYNKGWTKLSHSSLQEPSKPRPCSRGRISSAASFTHDNGPQSVNNLFAHLEICTLTPIIPSWSKSSSSHFAWMVRIMIEQHLKTWIFCIWCEREFISQPFPVV